MREASSLYYVPFETLRRRITGAVESVVDQDHPQFSEDILATSLVQMSDGLSHTQALYILTSFTAIVAMDAMILNTHAQYNIQIEIRLTLEVIWCSRAANENTCCGLFCLLCLQLE